jgi:hypothetical protein
MHDSDDKIDNGGRGRGVQMNAPSTMIGDAATLIASVAPHDDQGSGTMIAWMDMVVAFMPWAMTVVVRGKVAAGS